MPQRRWSAGALRAAAVRSRRQRREPKGPENAATRAEQGLEAAYAAKSLKIVRRFVFRSVCGDFDDEPSPEEPAASRKREREHVVMGRFRVEAGPVEELWPSRKRPRVADAMDSQTGSAGSSAAAPEADNDEAGDDEEEEGEEAEEEEEEEEEEEGEVKGMVKGTGDDVLKDVASSWLLDGAANPKGSAGAPGGAGQAAKGEGAADVASSWLGDGVMQLPFVGGRVHFAELDQGDTDWCGL